MGSVSHRFFSNKLPPTGPGMSKHELGHRRGQMCYFYNVENKSSGLIDRVNNNATNKMVHTCYIGVTLCNLFVTFVCVIIKSSSFQFNICHRRPLVVLIVYIYLIYRWCRVLWGALS